MRIVSVIALVLTVAMGAGAQPARTAPKITLDRIVKNDSIVGTVTGLTEAGRARFKVVVYIRTNAWYVHPFAQGGEGKEFALIGSDGSWSIETEYRDFPASEIAALLVPRDSKNPAQVANVRRLPNEAIVVRTLEGTPDYGKV